MKFKFKEKVDIYDKGKVINVGKPNKYLESLIESGKVEKVDGRKKENKKKSKK